MTNTLKELAKTTNHNILKAIDEFEKSFSKINPNLNYCDLTEIIYAINPIANYSKFTFKITISNFDHIKIIKRILKNSKYNKYKFYNFKKI